MPTYEETDKLVRKQVPPIAALASPRRGGGRRCRRLAWTADGGRHRLVS